MDMLDTKTLKDTHDKLAAEEARIEALLRSTQDELAAGRQGREGIAGILRLRGHPAQPARLVSPEVTSTGPNRAAEPAAEPIAGTGRRPPPQSTPRGSIS